VNAPEINSGAFHFWHITFAAMTRVEQLYEIYKQHPAVQTDTRKLKAGDIFFEVKGANFNGHKLYTKRK